MITQKFKQGKHEIRIENAESLEDAKKNNFPDGVYNRFFINGKPVTNYMAFVRFIVDEIKNNKTEIIPQSTDLIKKRNEIIQKNNENIKKEMLKVKELYGKHPVANEMLKNIDDVIKKIDENGVRINE